MGAETRIEWADHTFNPWMGCQAVSPACDHCYAETLATGRLGVAWGPHAERRRTKPSTWTLPLRWNRQAEREGVRYRVFCASLADVFDNKVPLEWREDLWRLIRTTPHLDWLLLTKRPQNIARMLPGATTIGVPAWGLDGWPNVWLGTTAEDQVRLAERAWHLAQVPARIRFLSCEPMLGGLNTRCVTNRWGTDWDALTGRILHARSGPAEVGAIHWVIAGGESGTDARPMHPDWARSLRDQCQAAGVPYFHKQNGEWVSVSEVEGAGPHHHFPDGATVRRVGKKAAGAILDCREWREMPA